MKLVLRVLKFLFLVVVRGILPVAFVAGGLYGACYLIKTKPKPKRAAPTELVTRVTTMEARRRDVPVEVTTMGTVMEAEKTVLKPEVGGRLTWLHPNLEKGGRLRAGEDVVRIDDADYKDQVAQQRSAITRTIFDLKVEKGRGRVAGREWTLLGSKSGVDPAGRDLALRKPHIQAAQAAVASARRALALAERRVARTVIKAPFDAIVDEETLGPDQLVSPGERLATLVATDRFWVTVTVPMDRLEWIEVPGIRGATQGSPVTVSQVLQGGAPLVREGRVLRLLSSLDALGRMAQLLIEVPRPLETDAEHPLPLLRGAYVQVTIRGRTLHEVVSVPRRALRDGDHVWLVSEAGRLLVEPVTVAWRRNEDVLVSRGLVAGDRIITSGVPIAVPGMALVVVEDAASGPEPPAGADRRERRPAVPNAALPASADSDAPAGPPEAPPGLTPPPSSPSSAPEGTR